MGDTSDLAILILRYGSDLPAERLFRMTAITTRLPRVGEPLSMVGDFEAKFIERAERDGPSLNES